MRTLRLITHASVFLGLFMVMGLALHLPTAAALTPQTDPPTNVMHETVTLEGTLSIGAGETGTYWFEYRTTDYRTIWELKTTSRSFGPSPTATVLAVSEILAPTCEEIEDPCTDWFGTHETWIYRLCAHLQGGVTKCYDGSGTPDGREYDAWVRDESWDDTSHEDEGSTCPAEANSSSEGSMLCYEPQQPSLLDHSQFSFHRSDTAKLQTLFVNPFRFVVWGKFQHYRDLVFNGSRAQIWQAADYFDGPLLRYDFKVNIYRGESHDQVVRSFRDITPTPPAFSSGREQSDTWNHLHKTRGPFHVHYALTVRANGRPNPGRPDGLWVMRPKTRTPHYYCELDADGERVCKFPD